MGETWVSSVLYILLGLIVISILLSSFLPLIDKMKDKNTFIQTKNLMSNLDSTIKETIEGTGSQREFFLDIQMGDFVIDSSEGKEEIKWKLFTDARLMEPRQGDENVFKEGDLTVFADNTGGYSLNVVLGLKDRGINLDTQPQILSLKGQSKLIIKNEGKSDDSKTKISIST